MDLSHQALWRDIVADLLAVQRHTYSVVRMPETLTADSVAAIRRAGRLLRGETVTEAWTHGSATATLDNPFGEPDFALAFSLPLTLALGDELIETDRMELTHTPHARLENTTRPPVAGDTLQIVYVEAPTTRAVTQVAVENRPSDGLTKP